ncbi:MAG TPA: sterol desaturase family protein [Candidatus Baltobacteraceae bacterium]|nr:sterol desaturase family protein [Candidatus Baltobacteraceae bacterium]
MIGTFFRHGSNGLLLVSIAALCALFAAGGLRFGAIPLAAVAAGALVFFVSEYTTHRFLFHAKPSSNAFVLKLQHRLHYDHHVDPGELRLLFLPVWFVVPVAALTFGIVFLVVRDVAVAAALILGSLLALFAYEWAHYVAHVAFVPRTPFGRYVKKYHLRHHFKNERLWFGVTNPAMDVVGGTYRRVDDAERSPNVRVLYPDA